MACAQTFFIYDRDMINPDYLSATGWMLFSELPGAERAAVELTNAAIAAMLAPNRAEADAIAWAALEKWVSVGACDTEPRNLMMSYLNAAHGVAPREPLNADEQAQLTAEVDAILALAGLNLGARH